jgi:hypothetical protein
MHNSLIVLTLGNASHPGAAMAIAFSIVTHSIAKNRD